MEARALHHRLDDFRINFHALGRVVARSIEPGHPSRCERCGTTSRTSLLCGVPLGCSHGAVLPAGEFGLTRVSSYFFTDVATARLADRQVIDELAPLDRHVVDVTHHAVHISPFTLLHRR